MNFKHGGDRQKSLFAHCCFWGFSHAPVDLVRWEKETTPASTVLSFVQEGGEPSAPILTGEDLSFGKSRKGVRNET